MPQYTGASQRMRSYLHFLFPRIAGLQGSLGRSLTPEERCSAVRRTFDRSSAKKAEDGRKQQAAAPAEAVSRVLEKSFGPLSTTLTIIESIIH